MARTGSRSYERGTKEKTPEKSQGGRISHKARALIGFQVEFSQDWG